MALIKCPECKKEISDKALQCIHCGYPIKLKDNCNTNDQTACQNNILVDIKLTFCPSKYGGQVTDALYELGFDLLQAADIATELSTIKSNITLEEANEIKQKIEQAGGEVEIYPATETARKEVTNRPKNVNELRCPRCGSTAITTGQRGYSLLTGFIGSKQTVNRCGNCGKSWYPTR